MISDAESPCITRQHPCEKPCTDQELADIYAYAAWVAIEEDEEIKNKEMEEALQGLTNDN